jgi:hypothetical protein
VKEREKEREREEEEREIQRKHFTNSSSLQKPF